MKEMKLPNINNPRLNEFKLNALKTIKSDSFFEEIINKYNLSDEDIIASASKLLKYKEDKTKCSACKGKCNKIPERIQMDLLFDEYTRTFEYEYNTCEYYKNIMLKRRKFLRMDFPLEYLDYDFVKELTNNDYTKVRADVIYALAKRLKGETNKGLFIRGDSRRGKTFITALFASKYVEKENKDVVFASSPALFRDLQDYYFNDKEAMKNLFDEIKDADLLVLDAFGDEYKSDFVRDTFVYPLLQERAYSNKITIINSNFTIKEIVSMYNLAKASAPKVRQLESTLLDLVDVVELKGYPYSL